MLLVSASQDDKVVRFAIDEATGRLTPAGEYSVPGGPAPMAVSPDGRTLYVSLRSSNRVAAFRIEAPTGDLAPLNEIDLGGSATFITTDRAGRFLLAAYYADGRVSVNQLESDGSVGERIQTVDTAEKAHCIVVDRSNRFVFVPHTGAEAIFQFSFDANSGQLTPNAAGHVSTARPDADHEPRHLWFHPTADFAYVSMERGSEIGAFHFDPQQGTLSFVTRDVGGRKSVPEIASTIPADFAETNSTADIGVTPDGRFAYVSNRGHDSIAGFRVDAETGQVQAADPPTTPTEKTPRSFNIHPSGNWMYVAGQGSGQLTAYRIGNDGGLTPLQTVGVGRSPSWAQVIVVPTE
ncbi:MAG: lactonase family protein [Planctomycetaceae bacterium]|nr:lactonase family protein [Planctomycetaceae bacterium]